MALLYQTYIHLSGEFLQIMGEIFSCRQALLALIYFVILFSLLNYMVDPLKNYWNFNLFPKKYLMSISQCVFSNESFQSFGNYGVTWYDRNRWCVIYFCEIAHSQQTIASWSPALLSPSLPHGPLTLIFQASPCHRWANWLHQVLTPPWHSPPSAPTLSLSWMQSDHGLHSQV